MSAFGEEALANCRAEAMLSSVTFGRRGYPAWIIDGARAAIVLILLLFVSIDATPQEPGILRVGGDIDYRPYSFLNEAGAATGFDVELMQLLAGRLGLKPEVNLAAWNRVLDDLENERLDVVVGALFTISRSERFIFTDPYNTDAISIFLRDDAVFEGLRDLEGRVVATLQGDAIPETVLSTNGIDSESVGFPTMTEALKSVSTGATDYTLVPYAVGMEITEQEGIDNLRIAGPPLYAIQYRLALPRSQAGFRDQINRELDVLVETSEYAALRERWLRHERRDLTLGGAFRKAAPVLVPLLVLLLAAWVLTLKHQVAVQTKELAAQSAALKALATQDDLTGLANRRLLATMAEKELTHAQRRGERLSVLFMDLDSFKVINDTFGHSVGDTVLVEFARRTTGELREYDIFARHGGEEFVVLLRDSDFEEAHLIAERIRHVCEAETYELGPEHPAVRITVSIGVATLSGNEETFAELLGRADGAMYQAKQSGRNRVCGSSKVM